MQHRGSSAQDRQMPLPSIAIPAQKWAMALDFINRPEISRHMIGEPARHFLLVSARQY
jgi:hypothetical protein